MGLYYEGFRKAQQEIQNADLNELLRHIDGLYGRDNIEDESDIKEVRTEALRQCKEDFTDKASPEYSMVGFYNDLLKAQGVL